MSQLLVLHKDFYESATKNIEILKRYKFNTADSFIKAIISKLNDEFNYLEIEDYRFFTGDEKKDFSQYGAFIEGDDILYERIIVFFTPIDSKSGNVVVEQSLMPTICKQMEKDVAFLLNEKYKKIVVLTSQINLRN